MMQVVSFDNLEDQELEKRDVSEGLFLVPLRSELNMITLMLMVQGPSYFTRRSTIGDRAFPVASSHVWNSLPQHATSVSTITACLLQPPQDSLLYALFPMTFTFHSCLVAAQ